MRFPRPRFRLSPREAAIAGGVIAAVALLALVGQFLAPQVGALPDREVGLVTALVLSLGRLTIGYVLSLAFAIAFGVVAATRPRARRVLLPFLDIGQSVPIPALFPVVIVVFIHGSDLLLGADRLGIELACIFLIFTVQVWNLAFGVYEGITQIPEDLRAAADAFGLSATGRFLRLYLPACCPKLVYNSIASWANGWYFLTLCEVVDATHKVPGIGSYLNDALSEGGSPALFWVGLALVIAVVVGMELLVWRPLTAWVQKFRYDAGTVEHAEESIVLNWWKRSKASAAARDAVRRIRERIQRASASVARRAPRAFPRLLEKASAGAVRLGLLGFFAFVAASVVGGAVAIAYALSNPWPADAFTVPIAVAKSALRIFFAYGLALAWTVPIAFWVARSATANRIVTPAAEILSAVPAAAVFPLLQRMLSPTLGANATAVAMLMTGMQWYLLFNLIEGVKRVPADLHEAAASLGLSRAQMARRLMLPAMMPALVTGSVTSWGGGWNALIVAERFSIRGEVFECDGLGNRLMRSTGPEGDPVDLALNVLALLVTVAVLNRVVWHRLYDFAEDRFRIEA